VSGTVRILYFSRDYTPHDRRFLERMARSRHEIHFLSLEQVPLPLEQRPLPSRVRACGSLSPMPLPPNIPAEILGFAPAFELVLQEVAPDFIHAGPVSSCGFLAALAGLHPFLAMSWGSDLLLDAGRDPVIRWMTRFTLSNADYFQCDCQTVLARALEFAPLEPERVLQFPWGVDLGRFKPGPGAGRLRGELGWEDACILLSSRSWEPLYDTEILLQGFLHAHALDPSLRLVMAGDGSQGEFVRRFIGTNRLEDSVYLPGRVGNDSMPDLMRAADAYVSAAPVDGTSISLLEAMASGLPVIVADGPGNREWVEDGRHGRLFKAGDPEGLARMMGWAGSLPGGERQRIGERNRAVACTRADWERNSGALIALYDRLENVHD